MLLLTNTYACVAFLKARTRQDIFNVAKLRWRNQTDHQLVQDSVHVRGLQMGRGYRGSPPLIYREDISYKQERINHAETATALDHYCLFDGQDSRLEWLLTNTRFNETRNSIHRSETNKIKE